MDICMIDIVSLYLPCTGRCCRVRWMLILLRTVGGKLLRSSLGSQASPSAQLVSSSGFSFREIWIYVDTVMHLRVV
jgi:hypothetical protein